MGMLCHPHFHNHTRRIENMRNTKEPRKLNINVDKLFKTEEFKIQDEVIVIQSFSLAQWIKVVNRINKLIDKFNAAGITLENYKTPTNIAKLVDIILTDFPDILEETTGVSAESIMDLPPEYSMGLIAKVIEIQMDSKDDFLKNLNCLTARLPQAAKAKVDDLMPKVE